MSSPHDPPGGYPDRFRHPPDEPEVEKLHEEAVDRCDFLVPQIVQLLDEAWEESRGNPDEYGNRPYDDGIEALSHARDALCEEFSAVLKPEVDND